MEYKVKYKWIKQEIKEKIERHELKEGQVIPSESELCARYQVSRITVRKAIDELVRDGLVYRIKGKGTFVQNLEKKDFLIFTVLRKPFFIVARRHQSGCCPWRRRRQILR